MRTVFESRASTILFNLLRTNSRGSGVYLLPANVCPIVPFSVLTAGAHYEFIDINPVTLCMDWGILQRRIVENGKSPVHGIIYVRTYGYCDEDVGTIFADLKSKSKSLLIVDDRCLTRPEPDSSSTDLYGADVILYSTGYGKYVDLGEGGFAHLRDSIPYESHVGTYQKEHLEYITRIYKQHICDERALYRDGNESQIMTVLEQACGWLETEAPAFNWQSYTQKIIKQRKIVDSKKQKLNAIYHKVIPESIKLPRGFHTWRFQIQVEEKKRLLADIFDAGFFASGHFFPASRLFGGRKKKNADNVYRKVVNLFNDMHVDEYKVDRVAEVVRRHVKIYGVGGARLITTECT